MLGTSISTLTQLSAARLHDSYRWRCMFFGAIAVTQSHCLQDVAFPAPVLAQLLCSKIIGVSICAKKRHRCTHYPALPEIRLPHSIHHSCMLTTSRLSNRNCPNRHLPQQMRGNKLLLSTPGTFQPDHVCRSSKQSLGNKVCRDLHRCVVETPGSGTPFPLRFHD